MDTTERIALLLELMSCNHDIYYWCFDKDLKVISSTAKDDSVLKRIIFKEEKHFGYLQEYVKEHSMPLISSTVMGLVWASVI